MLCVCSGRGHAHPDHSSSYSLCFLAFISVLSLPYKTRERLFKQFRFFIINVIFTDTPVPPLQLSSQRQVPNMHRSVQVMILPYRPTHRPALASDVQLTSSRSARMSRKNLHIYKCRGISSKAKISFDSATLNRSSSSSSRF